MPSPDAYVITALLYYMKGFKLVLLTTVAVPGLLTLSY